MNKFFTLALPILSLFVISSKLYASPVSFIMETEVDTSKLSRTQLMTVGATLPGKLYRISDDKTCVISLDSISATRVSKGLIFSSVSTEVLRISNKVAIERMQIVNEILYSIQQQPELFQPAMDQMKNVDLSILAQQGDTSIAEKAQAAINLLNSSCP